MNSKFNKNIRSYGRINGRGKKIDIPENDQSYFLNNTNISKFISKNTCNNINIEVGFGMGDRLYNHAQNLNNDLFIGFEPYITGINSLFKKIKKYNINNIKLYKDDFREAIEYIPKESISEVAILFPDPWPKKAHHKRRLVSINLLKDIYFLIKNDGKIIISTDSEDYAKHINQCTITMKHIFNTVYKINLNPIGWIETKYYKKAIAAKSNIHFFYLHKI